MAEGYSIAEAAKLLGIPQRRVLQLLERGVLSAAVDERRRWRVYLAAADAPASLTERDPSSTEQPTEQTADRATRGSPANGDHFSELLAELRHLQERYGQALLALGEARGETAALRSRVELLEGGPALAPAAPAPAEPARAPVPVVEAPPVAEAPPAHRVRRRSRTRAATAGLAEALARADDPSRSELPGGREAERALDVLSTSRPADAEVRAATDESSASAAAPAPRESGLRRLGRWFGR